MFETPSQGRRRFLGATLCGALASCGGGDSDADAAQPPPAPSPTSRSTTPSPSSTSSPPPDDEQRPSRLAVAVVRVDKTVYAKGFGTRLSAGHSRSTPTPCSSSRRYRSRSAPPCVVAQQVGTGASPGTRLCAHTCRGSTLSTTPNHQEVTVARPVLPSVRPARSCGRPASKTWATARPKSSSACAIRRCIRFATRTPIRTSG